MTSETLDDWETVKPDGTIKRYPVDGGWIYGVWEWRERATTGPADWEGGDWLMITSFYVADLDAWKRKLK